MTTGFMMNAEVAEKFFDLCLRREAVTEAEKVAILVELAQAGEVGTFQTEYGKATVVKRLSSMANVYKITKTEPKEKIND